MKLSLPGLHPSRHGLLLAAALLAVSLACPAALQAQWSPDHWVGTWGAGSANPAAGTQAFSDQTLRLVARTSIGGNRLRVRLTNEMGNRQLRIGEARIALHSANGEIVPGTDRALTFAGQAAVTIAPGAPAVSDPVELNVAPLSELAVSLYLPETALAASSGPPSGASYVSLHGNYTSAAVLQVQRTIAAAPFLAEVYVDRAPAASIVTLGDPVVDGARWLSRRLQGLRDGRLGVVSRGGSGALEGFDRDVLATAGVRAVALFAGIDDKPANAQELIEGYRQLIARARQHGLVVYGATLTPFEGAGLYSPAKEEVRQAVNEWIRNNGEFDVVLDFDRVMRDPAHSARLLPAYDSGDHLRPNDQGYQAMDEAVPLELFRSLLDTRKR